jgi:hypothetical protein
VDIAHELRALNNYSALRAFVAGINNSTFQGDETMVFFKKKKKKDSGSLQESLVLGCSSSTLRGSCKSDLIRAHEGNPNVNLGDPSKIHWGKCNMFDRLIQTTTHCQAQCRTNPDYCLPSRDRMLKVIFNEYVMSEEVRLDLKTLTFPQ